MYARIPAKRLAAKDECLRLKSYVTILTALLSAVILVLGGTIPVLIYKMYSAQ